MAQMAKQQLNSGRAAALERRRALSTQGKAGVGSPSSPQRTRAEMVTPAPVSAPAPAPAPARAVTTTYTPKSAPHSVGRTASQARRAAMSSRGKAGISTSDRLRGRSDIRAPETLSSGDCGCGCKGEKRADGSTPCGEQKPAAASPAPVAASPSYSSASSKRSSVGNTLGQGRLLAQARRQALAKGGKSAQTALKNGGISAAQLARQTQPNVSGRELARCVREERSRNGARGQRNSAPSGRTRPKPEGGPGAAQDAPWKVGAGETPRGQTVTGTMVGRSQSVTGDEPSTCRSITGTDYLGADIFRNFCQAEAAKSPVKVGVSPTSHGMQVTGTMVGRGERVTGDEPGTCKRVTGTEYVSANQGQAYCGTSAEAGPRKVALSETLKGLAVSGNLVGRSGKVTGDEAGARRQTTGTQVMRPGNGAVPPKVGMAHTLRGGSVTGTLVGRAQRMTGDEPGSCRNVTGDEYIGQEQYKGFCEKVPNPQDAKVGTSRTFKGEPVTGTMTGRATRVTGDEPGTCKPVTGTPYAGVEQYDAYCDTGAQAQAQSRTRALRMTPGSVMTGLQPGIKGKMTGDARGACEPVSGTPYVGADQYTQACGDSAAAMPGGPDFPQAITGGATWTAFSVSSPAREAQLSKPQQGAVTGTSYEQGHITGPFGMGTGKVTGTEQFRFGAAGQNAMAAPAAVAAPAPAAAVEERPRVTGEGMSGTSRITGDDWDRGDRVTGTEGRSATRRNPTRRGAMTSVMPGREAVGRREKDEESAPASRVTGSAGNYDRGAIVTVSGGARG